MKIVINKCFGGFSLSHKGVMRYAKIKGIKLYAWIDDMTKKVYKDKATIDNADIFCIHYATKPIKDESDYKKKGGDKIYWSDRNIKRDDPALIQTVKELGKKASGRCAELGIVTIPNSVEYEIDEYDGNESIHEKHRSWS